MKDIWQARAEAMRAIVQAAQAVADARKPWRIELRTGEEAISTDALDRLEHALEAYRALAKEEHAHHHHNTAY